MIKIYSLLEDTKTGKPWVTIDIAPKAYGDAVSLSGSTDPGYIFSRLVDLIEKKGIYARVDSGEGRFAVLIPGYPRIVNPQEFEALLNRPALDRGLRMDESKMKEKLNELLAEEGLKDRVVRENVDVQEGKRN
ncbi:MAG: hypothetical protein HYZ51_03260 [Candidatus Doudnabacteria bacterium]|nr:hypothetical protein [Candidatus Doudnabacteria bacterium]